MVDKYFPIVIIFLMGFLLTLTPQLMFLQFWGINWGLQLNNVLDLLGIILMLYATYQILKIYIDIKR